VLRALARRLLRVVFDGSNMMTSRSVRDVTPQSALGTADEARNILHASEGWRTGTVVPSKFTSDRRPSNEAPIPPRERDDDELRIVLMSNISCQRVRG